MHRPDKREEEDRRPTSRRNSASRRGSIKKEPESAPSSSNSTPKRVQKPQNLDFVVTGKQIFKRNDRTTSLPGVYHRRLSADSLLKKKAFESPKRTAMSQSSKSRDTSLDEDMSLDLSQVSDFEDTISKYGIKNNFAALATSTPKRPCQKTRSASQGHVVRDPKTPFRSLDSRQSRDSTFTCSRDSVFKSSTSSPYRQEQSVELDYSSVSPEYSGPSSGSNGQPETLVSPHTQDMHDSSCCVSTWQEEPDVRDGEWSTFWANYNNSIARVPISRYYDQCPTPYRTEDIELADLVTEFSAEGSKKRSPDDMKNINNIIRNEGLHLTPRETQSIIKCAHILGSVLSKAIDRSKHSEEKLQVIQDKPVPIPEAELKKKNMSLDLKETVLPVEVKEEKRWETVTTQTDISLPNTKSAPRIFENILRQLSKSSLDDAGKKENGEKQKEISENGVPNVGNGT